MIKTAYIDCFSGLSGDMFLGALIDLGVNEHELFGELEQLALSGYHVDVTKESRQELTGTRVKITCTSHHEHRSLSDIERIMNLSNLPDQVIETSLKMFRDLVMVEARIHGTTEDEVVLHEVGAVDAILDIVGTCLAIHTLKIEKVFAAPVPLGKGFVKAHHGVLPVPAPATVALMEGIPCYSSDITGELTTPTGAVIVKNLAQGFGAMPLMTLEKTGYGVGSKKFPGLPNLLRIISGYMDAAGEPETVYVVQANIDDQIPEQMPYLMEKLFDAGALDVYWTPIQMKKNRPGVMIEIISPRLDLEKIVDVVLKESTTIGLRYYQVARIKLDRLIMKINTEWGDVRIKISYFGDTIYNKSPEYEDCAHIARNHNIPLKEVYNSVLHLAAAITL